MAIPVGATARSFDVLSAADFPTLLLGGRPSLLDSPTLLHWGPPMLLENPPLLAVVVVLSGIVMGILAILGVVAFSRRRTAPYLLVALALVALSTKAVVAVLSIGGVIGPGNHEVLEHAMDLLVATLLLGAIVEARTPGGRSIGRWLDRRTD